ncbi:glucose-6-phosphate dehydrogenase [Brachybacterium phenoliresistens]|uniref:glucose-6-phosphate dehydrogenase n=1 Tax=Brachybacterium phenoliresistens TaxID=396014 RepID=UPI003383FDF0
MSDPTLLILGATGDLTLRLLLPGIGSLLSREPGRRLRVIGVGRRDRPRSEFAGLVADALASGGAGAEAIDRIRDQADHHRIDMSDPGELARLLDRYADAERLVLYFALPPEVTRRVCAALRHVGLGERTHLALEKPFGSDLRSSRDMEELVLGLAPPERIHRIDHFLGMSSVQRLAGCDAASDRPEEIEICFEESLALEGRAGYYDGAGALVDMIQSHLLLVLAELLRPAAAPGSGSAVHEERVRILRALRPWGGDPASASRRGRYTAGSIGGRRIPAYTDETGVDAARGTETLAQITVEVDLPAWAGVPITLRSGKALGAPAQHVALRMPDAEPVLLPLVDGAAEGTHVGAYGAVVGAVLDGRDALGVGSDAVEECWRIIDEVRATWSAGGVEMDEYSAGSGVPETWRPRARGGTRTPTPEGTGT